MVFKRLGKIISAAAVTLFLAGQGLAFAVDFSPTSITDNSPGLLSGSLDRLHNNIILGSDYVRVYQNQPAYTWFVNFDPRPGYGMIGFKVWANGGSSYGDGELRTFDLSIDYLDGNNTLQTLYMNGVDIGDTLSEADVKTVPFMSGGVPVTLFNVTQVRVNNMSSAPTGEIVVRELAGAYSQTSVDLVTVKSITSGTPYPNEGDTVTFQITVTNNGSSATTTASLTDLLPAGLTPTINNGAVTSGSYNAASGLWSNISVGANGGTATLTLEGTVNAGQKGQIITNTTTAADDAANDENYKAGDQLTQSVAIPEPVILVTKTADKTTQVAVGETITYTYVVTNTGNVPVNNIYVTDTHNAAGPAPTPAGEIQIADVNSLNDSSDNGQDGIWDILGPGDSVQFTGTYVVQQSDIDNLQ